MRAISRICGAVIHNPRHTFPRSVHKLAAGAIRLVALAVDGQTGRKLAATKKRTGNWGRPVTASASKAID